MSPNPFSSLLHSRKFWLVVLDGIAAVLGLWVSTLVSPEMADRILATWGILSGVLAVAIGMIAYEDKARLQADASKAEALAYATEAGKSQLAYRTGTLRDITLLIGLAFANRKFRGLSADAALDYFTSTFRLSDLTPVQEAAFRAAFANPAMRAAVDGVWATYDQERATGALPAASPWYD